MGEVFVHVHIQINLVSKEISRAEHEIWIPTPIKVLPSPLFARIMYNTLTRVLAQILPTQIFHFSMKDFGRNAKNGAESFSGKCSSDVVTIPNPVRTLSAWMCPIRLQEKSHSMVLLPSVLLKENFLS